MADITEEELEKEIAKILENANLAKTSTKKVIQQLEKNLGADLTDRKKVIDKMVMDFVNKQESDEDTKANDDDDDEDEEEEEEVEEKKPKKRGSAAVEAKIPKKRGPTYIWRKSHSDSDDYSDKSEEEKKPPKKKSKKKKGSDGDSDDDWGKKNKPKKAAGGGGGSRGKGKGGGYTRAYKLSPQLAELMGQDEMPRHEVVKRVWEIIKKNNLYDQNNKQFAICDDALYKVFGIKRFRTFGMMKYLKTHFIGD